MPDHLRLADPNHVRRVREANSTLLKLIRRARRDAWDDAVLEALTVGHINADTAADMYARNPNRNAWTE